MKKISEMTLKEKIGQLFIVGFSNPYYDENIKDLIEENKVGNIILFARNYENANQLKKLNTCLHQEVYKNTGIIPFIMMDQEGGMVTRMMTDVTFPPSQMTSSASNFDGAIYECGKMIARDMIKLGMNLDLAPCLEINPGLENVLTNVRSYSSNPMSIAKKTNEFLKGLKEYGVLGCAKHFPGAGFDEVDSHLDLPIINENKETVFNTSLVPFRKNIDVDAIMTTHSLFKAYDDLPATMSEKVITGLLRKTLGYEGMIISDCMEMKAIENYYGTTNGILMALKAGCDMVIVSQTYAVQKLSFNEVYQAIQDGRITEEEINEKVKRILKFKEKSSKSLKKYFIPNEPYQESKLFKTESLEIVEKSLTLIKGTNVKVDNETVIITATPNIASFVEDVFDKNSLYKEIKNAFKDNMIISFNENRKILLEKIKKEKQIVILSYDVSYNHNQKEIINEILTKYENVYVISFKGPFDQKFFTNLKNYLCLYEYTPNAIITIIKYLKGEIKPEGKLPLD